MPCSSNNNTPLHCFSLFLFHKKCKIEYYFTVTTLQCVSNTSVSKSNNKITELRTILQRESQNS